MRSLFFFGGTEPDKGLPAYSTLRGVCQSSGDISGAGDLGTSVGPLPDRVIADIDGDAHGIIVFPPVGAIVTFAMTFQVTEQCN